MNDTSLQHILIFEPRSSGHHPGWLAMISNILVESGYRVTLAVDTSPEALRRLEDHFKEQLKSYVLIPVKGPNGKWLHTTSLKTLGKIALQTNPDIIFLPNLNEIASKLWRLAFLGIRPPLYLKGKLAGIYLRPLFLSKIRKFTLIESIKRKGFWKLVKEGWFYSIFFLNPWIYEELKKIEPQLPFYWLPDPYPPDFERDKTEAKKYFQLPFDKRILLFYGGPYKRKGLDLALKAFDAMNDNHNLFLLCAGEQPSNKKLRNLQTKLINHHKAMIVDRYVTLEEEKLLFAAADIVLLPYRSHYETSGVFSRAMGAGKAVIVSDEYLLGYLTKQYKVGCCFESGNLQDLIKTLMYVSKMDDKELMLYQQNAKLHSNEYSPDRFKNFLLNGLRLQQHNFIN